MRYAQAVFGRLLLLFTLIPFVEVMLLLELGGAVGAPATIALVLLTGIIGAALAKKEGTKVLREWQSAMAHAQLPKDGVLSGLLVLVGGVLLITPGVLTDAFGFALLIAPARRAIANTVRKQLVARGHVVQLGAAGMGGMGGFTPPAPAQTGEVIDVEAHERAE